MDHTVLKIPVLLPSACGGTKAQRATKIKAFLLLLMS